MKYVQQLSIAQLQAFTTHIVNLAFQVWDEKNARPILDPDKELDSDTLAELVGLIRRFDLAPDKVETIDPIGLRIKSK